MKIRLGPVGNPVVLVERFASIGLTLLLLASGIFTVMSARTMAAALHNMGVANALNDDYGAARYAVAAEESLERKYRLEPGAAVRAEHRAAQVALTDALRSAATLSSRDERAVDADVLRVHRKYVQATTLMFAAVDKRQPELALRLDHDLIDPVFGLVQTNVFSRAAKQRLATNTILEHLHALEQQFVMTAIALSAISFICFAAYTVVLSIYKRRLVDAHEVERRQLSEAASTDFLTGIGNHRAYKEELQREISRAARHGTALALALVDIDEMKLINDQNGHLHGDRVLTALGKLLQELRAEDRSFRLGGDEFGVLLPLASARDAQMLMDRLRKSAATALSGATLSIGVAALDGEALDAEALHGRADAALYAAKRAGRNACVIFDETVDEMWLLSPVKIRRLRALIASEAVSVAFQPIWDVAECNILAYEALARPAPEYGFNGPQDVFDLAERVGRAHEIDAVCWRAALKRARELPPGALLFINMTPQSLDNGHLDVPGFAADVVAAGLTPQRVVIEITERTIVHLNVIISVAKQLQALGFRLALDDTGAGNAGLEMLSQLAVEFVKIDRGIIVKAMTDNGARAVMAGIVAIARATDAYVIAEGIEDLEMLDLACGKAHAATASQRGVGGVQGYLLRRPSEQIVMLHEAEDARLILQNFVSRAAGEVAGDDQLLPAAAFDHGRLAEVAR